jgi:hypothetical protein
LIPPDGKWLWHYNSRSIADDIKRAIDREKFYSTLPHKMDSAVEEYLAATEEAYEAEWEFWEKQQGETPLGGEMGVSYVSDRTNTSKDSSDN